MGDKVLAAMSDEELQSRMDDIGISIVTCCTDGGCSLCEADWEDTLSSRAFKYSMYAKELLRRNKVKMSMAANQTHPIPQPDPELQALIDEEINRG